MLRTCRTIEKTWGEYNENRIKICQFIDVCDKVKRKIDLLKVNLILCLVPCKDRKGPELSGWDSLNTYREIL